jgi:hypothetical protein
MAAEVVDAAIVGSPVCFASYGHPLVYCYPAILIQRAAKLLNLRVEMFPGISSLDTLLLDLRIDFAADGLQMYEATDLLLRRKPIQNPRDISCVCKTTCSNFIRLSPITLVFSKTFPLLQSIVEPYPLETLAVELEHGPQGGNLYIPPLRHRPVEDHELFEKLTA